MGTTSQLPQQLRVPGSNGMGRASLAGVLPAQGQQLTLSEIQGIFQSKRDFFILLRPSKPLPHWFAILELDVQCVASFHSGPHLPEEARN